MLLSLVAAVVLNSAPTVPSTSEDDLPALFVAACLDGSVSTNGATPIEFDALPDALRHRLGRPSTAKVWKLRASDNAYLYSLSYTERGWGPNSCGVASESLPIQRASAAMETRLRGVPSAGSYAPTEWLDPKLGYRALTTRVGGFTILQINTVNADKAEAPASR